MFKRSQKLCQIFSLTLLLASAVPDVAVAEEDYSNFPTGNHEGGGVRGRLMGCATDTNYPIPLVPKAAKTFTTSSSPMLFFDVPDVVQASTLEIVLRDRDDRVVYREGLETGYQPGIMGLNLYDESNSNALKVNNSYNWYLIQECDNIAEPNIVANGSLQRVELDDELAQKINSASRIEKVKLYQKANIWHEAIANLAKLKCDLETESSVSQQWIDEAFISVLNLSNQDFQSYCLDNSKLEPLAMQ